MPSHDIHKLISRLIMGTDGAEIHHLLDAPHKLRNFSTLLKLFGEKPEDAYKLFRPLNSKYPSGHRQVLHTLQEAAALGYLMDGPRGIRVALTHILADEHLTDQDKLLLAMLKNKPK